MGVFFNYHYRAWGDGMRTVVTKGVILGNLRIGNVILLFALMIIGGCAIGHKYDYSGFVANFDFSGNAVIVVAVQDQRRYVITESKNPDFIGLQRSVFGVPHDVCTENGEPLADNVAKALSRSLSEKGFNVTPVVLSYADKTNAALNKLAPFKADRLVLVIIEEWKTDTLNYSKLTFNLTLKVLDSDKHVLAVKAVSSDGQNIGTKPEVMAPRVLKEKIEELMNDPSITTTLANKGAK